MNVKKEWIKGERSLKDFFFWIPLLFCIFENNRVDNTSYNVDQRLSILLVVNKNKRFGKDILRFFPT